jgi:hypothetical protein
LKGRRDREFRLGGEREAGKKRPEKISHFLFGTDLKKINFVVPKAK